MDSLALLLRRDLAILSELTEIYHKTNTVKETKVDFSDDRAKAGILAHFGKQTSRSFH